MHQINATAFLIEHIFIPSRFIIVDYACLTMGCDQHYRQLKEQQHYEIYYQY